MGTVSAILSLTLFVLVSHAFLVGYRRKTGKKE